MLHFACRSVEAALTAGIDPYTLVHRPVEFFARPGQPQEITQLIYEEAEQVRRDKLDRLVRERARMVELDEQGRFKATFTGAKGSASRGANFDEKENEMVEKEAKRLAMLKERQQKELEQVRKYEETRLKIMLENEEALKREKHKGHEETLRQKQRDREWGEKQRVTELKKLQEEQELEKEQRRRDQIAYQKELEDLERQAKEEAVRRKLAYQRDQEAKIKAAAAKAETERLLREQQEAVERRRQEMDRKDAERRKVRLFETRQMVSCGLLVWLWCHWLMLSTTCR